METAEVSEPQRSTPRPAGTLLPPARPPRRQRDYTAELKTRRAQQTLSAYEFFMAGQPIFNPEEPSDAIYVVARGEVAIHLDGELIDTVEPGRFLVEPLISTVPGVRALAKTDTLLVAIGKPTLVALAQHPPEFIAEIMRMLVERLPQSIVPPIRVPV
jgi:CRP-like cAMP-binding protein